MSPAFRKADVSASVSARAAALKFCRKSLQGGEKRVNLQIPAVNRGGVREQRASLQLALLDEPALVLVDDVKGLFQLLRGFTGQPAGGEELLMLERAVGYSQCRRLKKKDISDQ